MYSTYIIGHDESGPFKVGMALVPEKRLRALQTGNHLPLQILFSRKFIGQNSIYAERVVHKLLENYRIFGEWFDVPLDKAVNIIESVDDTLLYDYVFPLGAPNRPDKEKGLSTYVRQLEYEKRRKVAGYRRATVWLSPEDQIKLTALRADMAIPQTASDQEIVLLAVRKAAAALDTKS